MGTRAKLILVVLLTLAFVAVTRETGNLTIQLYRAHYEGRDVAERESRRQTLDAGYGTTSYNTSTENTETTHDARGWDLGFGGGAGRGRRPPARGGLNRRRGGK